MIKTINILPPYPRLGEVYRSVAVALDTKGSNREVDELARKGDFDWTILPLLVKQLIVSPLGKYTDCSFANFMGNWIENIQVCYIRLVSTITLDSVRREDALPLLIENFFSLYATELLLAVKNHFGGPDLNKLFDSQQPPVSVIFDWLDEGENVSLIKMAFPKSTTEDRAEVEKIRKWRCGINLPNCQSIIQFGNALRQAGTIDDEKIKNSQRWLVLARALAFLENQSPIPFRAVMFRHLTAGKLDINIDDVLLREVIEQGKRFSVLSMPVLLLQENLKRTTLKARGSQNKTRNDLIKLESLARTVDPEGLTRYHIEWLHARWHVLSGDYESALQHYELAVEMANYRAGEQQKEILNETLVIAAHLRKKPLLKRLKHRAVVFNLFIKPASDDVVEDWEVERFSQQLHNIFPLQGRFKEASQNEEDYPKLPFLLFDEDSASKVSIDVRNPDRVISMKFADGQVRRWSQLRFFVSYRRFAEVNRLLEVGASVDLLDEFGASALLCAIQVAEQERDRSVLDLLLQYPHTSATLNSITTKKEITALFCAIEYGEPDVVRRILEMGAKANLRCNIIGETPLYYALELLGAVVYPERTELSLIRMLKQEPDLISSDISRRHGVSNAGLFGDSNFLNQLSMDKKILFNECLNEMVKTEVNKHSAPKLIHIIQLLIEFKADPNAPHKYPEPGRTPMMLAAEWNLVQPFELMLRHGGNPFQADGAGVDCRKIAMSFRSGGVIDLMRRKSIM